jgi:hypothetical protein
VSIGLEPNGQITDEPRLHVATFANRLIYWRKPPPSARREMENTGQFVEN